jgi:ferredoxin-thioredoxin reductase catalytic subunit
LNGTAEKDAGGFFTGLRDEAEAAGYHLNPDHQFTMQLVDGLMTNIDRFGYPLCPCRLSGGDRRSDLDIICPCDYRDQDLDEFDTCY